MLLSMKPTSAIFNSLSLSPLQVHLHLMDLHLHIPENQKFNPKNSPILKNLLENIEDYSGENESAELLTISKKELSEIITDVLTEVLGSKNIER